MGRESSVGEVQLIVRLILAVSLEILEVEAILAGRAKDLTIRRLSLSPGKFALENLQWRHFWQRERI